MSSPSGVNSRTRNRLLDARQRSFELGDGQPQPPARDGSPARPRNGSRRFTIGSIMPEKLGLPPAAPEEPAKDGDSDSGSEGAAAAAEALARAQAKHAAQMEAMKALLERERRRAEEAEMRAEMAERHAQEAAEEAKRRAEDTVGLGAPAPPSSAPSYCVAEAERLGRDAALEAERRALEAEGDADRRAEEAERRAEEARRRAEAAHEESAASTNVVRTSEEVPFAPPPSPPPPPLSHLPTLTIL
eukprot:tig00020999_g16964.t1